MVGSLILSELLHLLWSDEVCTTCTVSAMVLLKVRVRTRPSGTKPAIIRHNMDDVDHCIMYCKSVSTV